MLYLQIPYLCEVRLQFVCHLVAIAGTTILAPSEVVKNFNTFEDQASKN